MSLALLQRGQSQNKKPWMVPDSLTHNAGTITAIFGLTTYSVILSGLVANTRYQLYLVPGGTLVYSTNEHSIGPAGYTSWILIGSFYANGETSVLFGSFVSIDEEPHTDNWVRFTLQKLGFTTSTDNCRWKRKGRDMILKYFWVFNAAPTGTLYPEMPFSPDPAEFDYSGNDGHVGTATGNNGPAASYHGHIQTVLSNNRLRIVTNAGNEWAAGVPIAWGNGNRVSMHTFPIPILGWNATPIKDL